MKKKLTKTKKIEKTVSKKWVKIKTPEQKRKFN